MTFMTAEVARTKGDRSKFGTVPFLTPGRIDTLRDLLGELDGDGRTNTAPPRVAFEWNDRVVAASTSYTPYGPIAPVWSVPATYQDPDGAADVTARIASDFGTAVDLAFRWKVLGDAAAATKAVAILAAWTTQQFAPTNVDTTSPLTWCTRWPMMLQAAMLLRGYSGYTTGLDTALKDLTLRSMSQSLAYVASNNTAAWGVCFEIAAGVFLADRTMFDRAIRRWYSLFDLSIEHNVPVGEVYRQGGSQGDGRNGLWYSNFTVYAFTAAAEWARYGGEWLYDHTGPDGSTFRGLAEQVRFWTRYPETFTYNSSGLPTTTTRSLPHDEVLHALWPSPESLWIVSRFPTGDDRDSSGFRHSALIYRDRPLYG